MGVLPSGLSKETENSAYDIIMRMEQHSLVSITEHAKVFRAFGRIARTLFSSGSSIMGRG